MCLMWILSSLQAAGVSNGVGAGVVELDENGSVVVGGEQQGPSPLQGRTGASSEDLDHLEALRSISQVGFAAPCVLEHSHACDVCALILWPLPCSARQTQMITIQLLCQLQLCKSF